MKAYLEEYRRFILEKLTHDDENWNELLKFHEKQTEFFQHERLVHLMVTILFALLFVGTVFWVVVTENIGLLVLSLMFLSLEIPYIKHYFFLENQTQKLYDDYNALFQKANNLSLEFRKGQNPKAEKRSDDAV